MMALPAECKGVMSGEGGISKRAGGSRKGTAGTAADKSYSPSGSNATEPCESMVETLDM